MGIGGSIFLLALGAILAFAVDAQFSGIDINTVGYVLMAAGLIGLVLTIWFWNSRRQPRTTTVVEERPVMPQDGQIVDEYRSVRRQDPPPPTYGS